MPEEENENINRIENPGCLYITEPNGGSELVVPLEVADGIQGAGNGSIRIFDGGIVWEDTSYLLSFEYQTTAPIHHATLSVNDHSALYTTAEHRMMAFGGDQVFTHTHEVDVERGGMTARHPFSLTCGFARIEIRIEFFEGPDVILETPDIVSLDEPIRNGQTGEAAEESNVKEMYRALTRIEDNQAAEWMFAHGNDAFTRMQFSFDEDTDWAYAPMSMRLQVASDSLHCIFDGLEDTSDAFPTSLGEEEHMERANRRDTDENREVRALISSMEDQVRQMRDALHDMSEESSSLCERLRALVQVEGARRGHSQSLPAIQMIAQRVKREEQLFFLTKDLHWRIAEMLTFVDDQNEGFGEVGKVPFRVPERVGVYETDSTYAKLREAMKVWSICANEPLERVDVSLHAVKPDKLFEYSALHKMLDWLWQNGFEEDEGRSEPISHFEYSLEDWYPNYENERRCANTYHLVRKDTQGDRIETRIDLYYQPVLYLGEREENGITLHRVPRSAPAQDEYEGEFWTPDFMLAISNEAGGKTFLVDAKYCSRHLLNNKMSECFDKYVARAAVGQEAPGTGIDGVVLLAGKLDAPKLRVSNAQMDGGTFLRVIAPFNKNTGRRKLTQFFRALGVGSRR